MQMGDVPVTYADISKLNELTGFKPQISLEEGLKRFISWFKEYHRVD
jgi:UDP-glucuronate 4-epimerase